jgi:hypothetical protein
MAEGTFPILEAWVADQLEAVIVAALAEFDTQNMDRAIRAGEVVAGKAEVELVALWQGWANGTLEASERTMAELVKEEGGQGAIFRQITQIAEQIQERLNQERLTRGARWEAERLGVRI